MSDNETNKDAAAPEAADTEAKTEATETKTEAKAEVKKVDEAKKAEVKKVDEAPASAGAQIPRGSTGSFGSNTFAIARREFGSYFASPLGYIVIGCFCSSWASWCFSPSRFW